MKIEIAEHAGYCYGVERALKMTKEAASGSTKPIYTLGPIIHNPQVVESLRELGVQTSSGLNAIDDGTVVVRTHGVAPEIIEKAKKRGLKVIDATCPFVAKAQQRALSLMKAGYAVVIVGERNHPEVEAILAQVDGRASVIENLEDIAKVSSKRKIGVVVQTTQSLDKLRSIVKELVTNADELKIHNTICSATSKRQVVARQLASRADVILVVGGKNSANTSRLAQICREMNPRTHHIETADEIMPDWIRKTALVGITAGASTPEWILDEVVAKLRRMESGDES